MAKIPEYLQLSDAALETNADAPRQEDQTAEALGSAPPLTAIFLRILLRVETMPLPA